MKRLIAVLLMLCFCVLSLSGEGESLGIVYRVHGGKNPLVLLGSIHIGFEEMYPFGETLQNVLEESDVYIFECDTDGLLSLATIQNASRYHAGDALKCHVSEETYTLLEEVCRSKGLNLRFMETYKPWAIVNALMPFTVESLVPNADVGKLTELGVENAVKTFEKDKAFAYLESVQEQLDALNRLSDTLSEELLKDACLTVLGRSIPTGIDRDMKQWGKWWSEGNAEAFAMSYHQDESAESSTEYQQILMTERNDRMTERVMLCLESETDHSYLVTVGLMHLVLEEDSIISRLKQAGYSVEKIQ